MTAREGAAVDPARLRRWRDLLASERDAAELYGRLAEGERGERAEILRELAATELRHAAHWEARLREAGAAVPPPGRPSLRIRALGTAARILSMTAILPLIERAERSDAGIYDADPDAGAGMAADEREHARTLATLRSQRPGARRGAVRPQDPASRIARRETWHRGDRSGALRAAIFGVSDGLVSNTALVMGIAGSGAARSAIVLAGIAGLLAGAFSMAAGEYVSMAGQREMFEREIALEAAEFDENPAEEVEELVLIYRAKGLPAAQAREIAEQIAKDREVALDTLAREELGLDPDALGSPWRAAGSSLVAFAAGAFVVVVPLLVVGGTGGIVAALTVSVLTMLAVGAGIGVLNGRSVPRSALRQLAVGGFAAAVTFGVGAMIGTQIG